MRRPEDEVGTQQPVEMWQVQLQTQVTRDAWAPIQVLGHGWSLHTHPVSYTRGFWDLGGLQEGEVCHKVDRCVWQPRFVWGQIGRASCRERVYVLV